MSGPLKCALGAIAFAGGGVTVGMALGMSYAEASEVVLAVSMLGVAAALAVLAGGRG